jgi:hypothetical protein
VRLSFGTLFLNCRRQQKHRIRTSRCDQGVEMCVECAMNYNACFMCVNVLEWWVDGFVCMFVERERK